MSVSDLQAADRFDPAAYTTFRFVDRAISDAGEITLRYALDDALMFTERISVAMPEDSATIDHAALDQLLDLLHWVAGVSYYKAAVPPHVALEGAQPGPAAARLLEALYSEGLGEFAVVNRLATLPRPRFPHAPTAAIEAPTGRMQRVLVPVGGGKDSAVALEIVRASGLETTLFSVGNANAIAGTAAAAGLPRLQATRQIDPELIRANTAGALNGHVPITAIVSLIALITAALHGHDAVALANERSASQGNTTLDGVEVNHQFSKSFRAERLMADAVAEIAGAPRIFSVLRGASELSIARAFARLPIYHPVFTSCNRIFTIDPARRLSSWCGECDKCRFVFLILAPFLAPDALAAIFGRSLLDDPDQFEGFALLTGTGGHKPFECVGEVADSVAALRLIANDVRWREQRTADRLISEVLPRFAHQPEGDPARVFALSSEHLIPAELAPHVDALLGA